LPAISPLPRSYRRCRAVVQQQRRDQQEQQRDRGPRTATGQVLVGEELSHSVCPIIIELEPAKEIRK